MVKTGTKLLAAALLAGVFSSPALAQQSGEADLAAEIAAMRAEIQKLRSEVDSLRAAAAPGAGEAAPAPAPAPSTAPAAVAQAAPAAPAPTWRGAPQFSDKSGFSFKPRGLIQFDAGLVGVPGPDRSGTVGGLNYANLGWNTRARRLLLGAQGSLPGGFGYSAEFNFAQGQIGYEDIVLTYRRDKSPLLVTIGNFFPLASLETMTSSRVTSFLERATLTDAFGYNRRLGASVTLSDQENDSYTLAAGIFSQEIVDNSFARTGWQASVRGTYSPTLGDTRLHLGANFQHRVAQRDAQNVRYRARPLTQLTDQRFVDTGAIAADGDDIAGVELGAIAGPLHFAAEAQRVWVRGHRPGRSFGANEGAAGGTFFAGDPGFASAYGEVGFFLTGESRGYRNGRWDRIKVRKPFDKDGWGALQMNARVDYLDLGDRAGGALINGGRQLGYQASLIWNPTDYLRFIAQYGLVSYEGGPRAATVVPGSTEAPSERSFDVDTFGVRAQLDF